MTKDEVRLQELCDFLRAHRSRITPAEVGLPVTGRRRTPGLRREEVTQLAGVSATWYTWLEQKRPIGVSSGVLDNLSRVLRLDPVERMQLFQLALRQPVIDSAPRHETVSPPYRAHAPSDARIPAVVIGRRWDVLACNRGARAFLFDFEQVPSNERNLLCLMFTCTGVRASPVRICSIGRNAWVFYSLWPAALSAKQSAIFAFSA
ncbi:MAG TPA: helix-turn-helix domain-containing protein [Candidatus Binataceae bacterium]